MSNTASSSSAQSPWRWPVALGSLTASGLTTSLISDRWGDFWSWLGLGVPVLVMVWFGLWRQNASTAAMHPQANSARR